ncbi:MAG: ribonuclease D [Pseudomonadota bacterium]
MNDQSPRFKLIEREVDLVAYCERAREGEWAAIDTEFVRENTYYPILCLIQIATAAGEVACIDMQAMEKPQAMIDLLLDNHVVKVLHSGSQDMEIFSQLCGETPQNVFDTQIAAPLFGHPEQMGYASLVQERLSVTLDKTQSRTDWRKRPLTQSQLNYAADDVIYLAQLYPAMRSALIQSGRLEWLRDEFEQLCDITNYQRAAEDMWLRIRHTDRLPKTALSIVQSLACWREKTARNSNIPRNWVMKDDAIIDIARLQPKNLDDLESLRNLANGTVNKHGQTLLDIVEQARNRQPIPLPAGKRKHKPSAQQDALIDLLSVVAKLQADQHCINHAVLAPRKELEKLVLGDSNSRLLNGWRAHFVGKALQQLLRGEMSVWVNESGDVLLKEKGNDS